ncbi:MAG: polysaccharide biosynthesis tyrosine autokinase [Gemmatimonadota bacterium]|nr:polysaccharide biosynthesis tyrosine autokinase [Gemmatimonadota bacterium]
MATSQDFARRAQSLDLDGDGALGAVDPRSFLDVVARRWWVVALCASLALVGAFAFLETRVDRYSAEVILRLRPDREPLQELGLKIGGDEKTPSDLASEMEVVRSEGLIHGVVTQMGLQLVLNDARKPRSGYLQDVQVTPDAKPGKYLLSRSNGRIALSDADSEQEVAAAGRDGIIRGPGFSFRVFESAELVAPVELSVLHPEQAVERVRKHLRVERVKDADLIRVRYSSPDRQLSADLVNGLAGAFQQYDMRRARETATRRREFLEQQVAQVSDSVAIAQSELEGYQVASGTLNPEAAGQSLSQEYTAEDGNLRTLRFQEGILQNLVGSLRAGGAGVESSHRLLVMGRDLVVGGEAIYNRLVELETERRKLTASRFGYTDAGPEVEVLDSQISAAKQDMAALAEQSLKLVREKIAASEARRGQLQQQLGAIPGQSTSIARSQKRLESVQAIHNELVNKYHEAQMAEAVAGTKVEVVQPASVPLRPVPSHRSSKLALALAVGLLFGLGLVFGTEFLDMKVRHAEQVKVLTGLDILGVVPPFSAEADDERPYLTHVRGQTADAEAFRSLRTMLRFTSSESSRVLAVTSASPGDGKSTVTLNLALSMAMHGSRVLLIDADTRRPTLHGYFGVPQEPGLTNLLDKAVSPGAATRAIPGAPESLERLRFLPAGSPQSNSSELLDSPAFADFIRTARERFDVVVIDTPPVLAVADASAIAELVDGYLFVASYGVTDRFALVNSIERIRNIGANVLGLVMNRVPLGRAGYYGGYYSYDSYYQKSSSKKPRGKIRVKKILSRSA